MLGIFLGFFDQDVSPADQFPVFCGRCVHKANMAPPRGVSVKGLFPVMNDDSHESTGSAEGLKTAQEGGDGRFDTQGAHTEMNGRHTRLG